MAKRGRKPLFEKAMTPAERVRRHRALKRKAAQPAPAPLGAPALDDPAGAVCDWAEKTLKVPAGHPLEGKPMRPPEYIENFLRDGWGARESVLSIGRKNSKSGGLVILALAYLAGPVKQPGFRIGVWSYSKELASEFYKQAAAVVRASKLDLKVTKSPWPGRIENAIDGVLEIRSADKTSPHALGVDLAVIDEYGLWPERYRELSAGIRSAVSAKNGRIVICSIRSTGPMMGESLENPATIKHVYEAEPDCDITDRTQWERANPGLKAGIKSYEYMQDQIARLEHAPQDVAHFRAHDLNQQVQPTVEVLLTPNDIKKLFTDDPPPAQGHCYLGIDFGESRSATAATAIYPQTGLVLFWMGFGDMPSIDKRARSDNAPYGQMIDEGTLRLFPGRVTPVNDFIAMVLDEIGTGNVAGISGDSYKIKELQDALDQLGTGLVCETHKGVMKHGRTVRALQKLVLTDRLKCKPSAALAFAIGSHQAHRDVAGNPLLLRKSGRIDLLSSSLIAAGLAANDFEQMPEPQPMEVFYV